MWSWAPGAEVIEFTIRDVPELLEQPSPGMTDPAKTDY
jgi:hypothetical protein